MSVTDEIHEKLAAAFGKDAYELVDDSESHRGHGGFREGGESHFNIAVTSAKFIGLSRIQRHRLLHDTLGRGLLSQIHALSLDLQTPDQ